MRPRSVCHAEILICGLVVRANQRDLYHVSSLKDQVETVLRAWLGASIKDTRTRSVLTGTFRDPLAKSLGQRSRFTGQIGVLWPDHGSGCVDPFILVRISLRQHSYTDAGRGVHRYMAIFCLPPCCSSVSAGARSVGSSSDRTRISSCALG